MNTTLVSPKVANKNFPDVAHSIKSRFAQTLTKVGMSEIEIPIQIKTTRGTYLTPARADAYVSLDAPEAKGIHMSRLFVALQKTLSEKEFSIATCHDILNQFLSSHKDLSQSAYLNLKFELPLLRKALISENSGPRLYPISCQFQNRNDKLLTQIKISILYSSTCPCSAALARSLIQAKFATDFSDEKSINKKEILDWLGAETGILATPHGQRSIGTMELQLKNPRADISFEELISAIESALKTPVQTVVKREDEQEFARLNGSNLMFAEDAARCMADVLKSRAEISGFRVEARHMESLHPHDAVAVAEENFIR